jgi:hypothetical protein
MTTLATRPAPEQPSVPQEPSFPPLPDPAHITISRPPMPANPETASAGASYRPKAWEYLRDVAIILLVLGAPFYLPWAMRWVRHFIG